MTAAIRSADASRSPALRGFTDTLFPPATLTDAIARLGFVPADPIRAPARAQDPMLRHRVADYGADDLERRYAELDVEERSSSLVSNRVKLMNIVNASVPV
jgi:uncharacterized protein YcaQ